MKTKTVDLLDLSDSQKAEVLDQARAFLREQLAEKRFYSSVTQTDLLL